MALSGLGTPTAAWSERRLRAAKLRDRQPHAAQLLEFYVHLLGVQEPVYRHAIAADWLTLVQAPRGEVPQLRLERLPSQNLVALLQRFLRDIAPVATDVLGSLAEVLLSAGEDIQTRLVTEFVSERNVEAVAASLDCEALRLEFFPRALLQPVAEAMADSSPTDIAAWQGNTCPGCGWAPQAAVIRDEPDVKGRRLLVCSLCSTLWPFRRATCPNCGETDTVELVYHESDALPHVRVDECRTCSAYLKSVDLRKDGNAVPVVDDIATVELDLWCEEQELRKIQRNVLGL